VPELGVIIVLASLLGWWACKVTALNMGISDPGAIVWDEVVAFWLILYMLTPASFTMQLTAFLIFRFFDAAKPGPVAGLTSSLKALVGAALLVFCSMTLWRPSVRCFVLHFGKFGNEHATRCPSSISCMYPSCPAFD
jgi:hypothetical protein